MKSPWSRPRKWPASKYDRIRRVTASSGPRRTWITRAHPFPCTRTGASPAAWAISPPVDWTPPAEVPDDEYPLVLSTGRRSVSLSHPHPDRPMRGTERPVGRGNRRPFHPIDAREMGIENGDIHAGSVIEAGRRSGCKARVTRTSPAGHGLDGLPFQGRQRQLADQHGV